MKNLITYSLLCLGLIGCGISFKTLTLEDNLPVPKPVIGLGDFKATSIFSNSMADSWTENGDCVTVEATSVSHTGDQAISMNWDRSGCDWIGFGIGWNGWQPKDLSQIMENGAIEFYIRSIEGETAIPLLIFLLEDYGSVMSAAVFGSACLERYPIDENWQRATLPLSWFDYKECGIDLTIVKQLVMEMQNSGSVIIDDMRIVEYVEPPARENVIDKPSLVELVLPSTIFDDEFNKVWGLGQFDCREFQVSSSKAYEGTSSLHLKWTASEKCQWNRMGSSWTNWLAVDFTKHMESAALDFWMQGEIQEGNVFAGIQAYNYASGRKAVTSDFKVEESKGWTHYRIPIKEMKSGGDPWPRNNVKHLFFEVEGAGEVYIDNIQIVAQP